MKLLVASMAILAHSLMEAMAWTTGTVPADGVYKFTFGVDSVAEGFAVPASATYDVQGTGYYDGTANATFSYGFLGTTETSYIDDTPVGSKVTDVRQIDGFSVVEGQRIVLSGTNDLNGVSCVCGPAAADYLPANASPYEGRYPVRFAMRVEERAYYAVTCTVANASSTTNADVTLYSERSHLHAHHMTLAPGETRTFAWSVELAPNFCKAYADSYRDNAINICVVGENAALASVTVVKQPQVAGTVRGEAVDNMNVGKSIWICTDSTGCDYPMSIPFFSLQNYGGVGAGLSRWAPADISICNQGEGGLATNSKTHRQSCLLKPGDYLYVEYGHNESGVASYTNNLETYLADAKTAGAKLLVVSPVERHTSWNKTTQYWEASLAGIRDGGRAWVEDKIAQGETCVAFVDLNTHYLNWMNSEVDRICGRFPSMNRSAAINYYYQSAKGKNVDGTHLNTAGEDQGAYAFWQAALAVVAAGEDSGATVSQQIQAAVVKGITEGYQGKLGLGTAVANTPWLVTDEIIAAGVAPNSFWDTPVTTMLDYVNEAVVAEVAAWTNADGTVTISNVTMRILNPGNYYKAVVDVVSADAATTNRYFSYYNYDVGGLNASSGTLINPEQSGFLDSDKPSGGAKDRDTLTVPAGGKAYVWFAKADDATWQVGANAPCSAKYPVEAWSRVLVDDRGEDASKWSVVTQSEYTFSENEAGYYDFTGTGYGPDGKTKKNLGMFRDFDDAGVISNGRYRVSFKALYTAGNFTFGVQKAKGSTTSPTDGAVKLVQFTSKSAMVCDSGEVGITLVKDSEEQLQPSNRINVDAWTDVDMIVDMDLGTAEVSVGGSAYQTYEVPAYSKNVAIDNLPYNYFVFSLESQMSHFGALDDVKVVQLAATSTLSDVTVEAAPNDGTLGAVTINGESVASVEVKQNSAVALVAAPAEGCIFLGWLDENSEYVSPDAIWNIARCHNPVSVTADFRSVVYATAISADETMGSVKINGGDVSPLQVYSNTDIAFTAVSADPDMYAFVCWRDGDGNDVSSNATFIVENVIADCSYTATFREYGEDEDRVIKWDFSDFIVEGVAATANLTTNYNGLAVYLQNGDSLSGDGLYWANVGTSTSGGTVGSAGRHIEWTAPADGSAAITFKVGSNDTGKKVYPYLMVATNEQAMVTSGAYAQKQANAVNTDFTLTFNVEAGSLYKIYAYYYNRNSTVTITGITYTYAPVRYTATAAASGMGGATVNGGATAEVLAGKSATFTAWPVTAAYKFVNWTDGESNVVSTEATFSTNITEDVTYTANFAAREAGEAYDAEVDFEHAFGGDNAVTASSSTSITRGVFTYFLASGDSVTSNGVYWGNVGSKTSGSPVSSTGRHIEWTAPANGSATITFRVGSIDTGKKVYPYLMVATNEQEMVTSGAYAQKKADAANTDFTLTFNVEAGSLYKIYAYYYNRNSTIAISSITYTHASDTTTLSLTNDSESGAVSVNGVAGVTGCNVQKGEYVKLSVAPNTGSIFGGWKNANDEIVSEDPEIWVLADDAISLSTTWRSVNVHNFVWNPAVVSGNWNDAANWLYEGIAPAETYPSDVSQDVAIFNSEATVALASAASASNVWFNAAATLTGGYGITAKMVAGEGAVTLNNSGFDSLSEKDIVISNNLWVVGAATNWVNQNNASAFIYGDLKGDGIINFHNDGTHFKGAKLYGDNAEFAGEVIYDGGGTRRYQRWNNGNATSSNSFWRVKSGVPTGGVSNDDGNMMNSNGTYYFGGYSGNWWHRRYSNNYTMEIGAINRDSDISIYTYTHAPNITKVGTANLTLGTTKVNHLTINGGSVTMPIGIAPNTLTIAEGTEIRVASDTSWEAETVTNLFSYTTLAGTGAETLASQVKVTGLDLGLVADITIEGNVVKATIASATEPITDDENAVIEKVGDEYTIALKADTVRIFVPDGVTVSEVVVSTNTTTVTGFPAGAAAKVAVAWAGGSANYAIVKVEDGAVLLDDTKSVTVGAEEIPVVPAFADAGDEIAPLDVQTDTVAVGVKSIPGLVYRLVRGTSVTDIATPIAAATATRARVGLADSDPPEDAAFYRVTVSLK